MNAIEPFMRSRLQIATEHGPSIAGNIPYTRALEDFVGAVPGCEDVDRTRSCWCFKKPEEKAKTVDLRHAA